MASAPEAAGSEPPIERRTVKVLTLLSVKRARDMFAGNHGHSIPLDEESQRIKLACKIKDEYAAAQHLAAPAAATAAARTAAPAQNGTAPAGPSKPNGLPAAVRAAAAEADAESQRQQRQQRQQQQAVSRSATANLIAGLPVTDRHTAAAEASSSGANGQQMQVVAYQGGAAGTSGAGPSQQRAIMEVIRDKGSGSAAVSRRIASKWPKPEWHAPWKLYRVISGHLGWVRSIAFDPSNEWFATGSSDRTIKLWDTASGQLKLTLTGHIEQVTGLTISPRHPYMFSCSLDKEVKCWDLEQNKVIRNYHGHLSGVYSIAQHPTLDILMTGGRDSTCRVWDMRSKVQIFALAGHTNTVAAILTQGTDPQIITGSHDTTVRLWDLRKGATSATLTFHKKSVRALAMHPHEYTFASGGADNIKKFKLPDGDFLHNMLSQQRSIVNTLALNEDGVLVSGGDNGSLWFWDWKSGHCFQQQDTIAQPGSLESEAGIYAASFDQTGSRLVTCEADKTIKMWREDERATPETHPVNFRPPKELKRF